MIRFLAHRRSEHGSLPLAMLLGLVGMSLSAVLGPIVVGQIVATRTGSDRTLALRAAEAGLHSAMSQFRAATDNTGLGEPNRLPAGPLTGSIGPGGGQRYLAAITYRDLDGNALSVPLAAQPASAVVVATGIASATGTFAVGTPGSRTLQATYAFQLTNQNVPGGQIHVRGAIDLCLDAGTAKPVAPTSVRMQRCTGTPAQQIFAYNSDLTIMLVSSRTTANPLGWCLDAGTPHADGAQVKMQPCVAPAPARQKWSANDYANLMGTSDGVNLDNYCFNVQMPDAPGSLVVLSSSQCWGYYDNVQTFQPDPAVGAGAAGAATMQLVNYQQFGRCFDVTNGWTGSSYMIAWPCKQAPVASSVSWNQKWTLPAAGSSGRIYATQNGTDYCLTSPGTTATGAYPVLTACTSTGYPDSMRWTVYGNTEVYATAYRIMDSSGLCLAPADPVASPAETYPYSGPPISRILMRTCDGSGWQKWNAPADLSKPLPLTQIFEK